MRIPKRKDRRVHENEAWIAVGIGHALVILAINIGLFSLLALALRKRLFLVCAVYTGLIYGTRILGEDRYESTSLWALGAIFTLWMLRAIWPWVSGLLAIALATPGLWGRVPVYTTPADEQILFLLPGAAVTLITGIIQSVIIKLGRISLAISTPRLPLGAVATR